MKKAGKQFLIALCALLGFASGGLSGAWARETITLARNPNLSSAVNGVVLKEIYRQAGLELVVVAMPGLRGTAEASAGRVDGEVNRVAEYADNIPALIRVEPPIYYRTLSAFYKKSTVKSPIKVADDLKAYSIGVVRGFKAAELFVDGLPRIERNDSSEALEKMLELGRLDVVVDGTKEFNYYLERMAHKDIEQVELLRFPVYHFLHEQNRALVPVIGALIKKLSDSGQLAKMYEKAEKDWLHSGVDPAQ